MNESIFKNCWVPDPTNQGLGNILTIDCIPILFGNLILWALIFAGIAALVFIIFSGIKFITSSGDQKQVEGARKILTYAIAGLVLILLSFAILRFIADITNLSCITKFGFETCGDGSKPKPKPKPEPTPTPKKCNYDEEKECVFKNFTIECNCVPRKERECKTYGSGDSECGAGYYCNYKNLNPSSKNCSSSNPCLCKRLPDQRNNTSCFTPSGYYPKQNNLYLTTTECENATQNEFSYCLPTNPNLYKFLNNDPGNLKWLCAAPGTCICKASP